MNDRLRFNPTDSTDGHLLGFDELESHGAHVFSRK